MFKYEKLILIILCISCLFTGCNIQSNNLKVNEEKAVVSCDSKIKAVWITYYELSTFIKNKSQEEFETEFTNAIKKLKNMGFNTITVHVRPYADAFYKSNYFPLSKYCCDKQGGYIEYDPLEIICNIAKSEDIKVEAWVNPYRVSQNNDIDSLSDLNHAKIWHNDKEKSNNVYVTSKGIYFNPASKDVTELIVNGIKEIVKNYDIYSIHFDDYFYPTTDKIIDEKEYSLYIKNGGKMELSEWRRDNINELIKKVYTTIKSTNDNVQFGISPCADISKNYNELYADVKLWASTQGFVDYICPQVYYGFLNERLPFMDVVKEWSSFTTKELFIGLPLYKCNQIDKYASKKDTAIRSEFKDYKNIIARQIKYIEKFDNIKGYYIFSYSSLFDEQKSEYISYMLKTMQSSNQASNRQT